MTLGNRRSVTSFLLLSSTEAPLTQLQTNGESRENVKYCIFISLIIISTNHVNWDLYSALTKE